jgi:hypothetical protein
MHPEFVESFQPSSSDSVIRGPEAVCLDKIDFAELFASGLFEDLLQAVPMGSPPVMWILAASSAKALSECHALIAVSTDINPPFPGSQL